VQRDAERVFLAGEEWAKTLAVANVEVAPFKALKAAGRP